MTLQDILQRRLAQLLSVKSIVTLVLTVVFAVLAIRGTISPSDFMTIFAVIIAFYFGTQAQKQADAQPDQDGDGHA